ncbi:MAG TPA: ATP-binding protein [Pseudomonadota bacterium]|nr:ATP-binding protein [Pseudomonadota bacterium]
MAEKPLVSRSLSAVLHAVAQTVPCNSASLALLEEEPHALRLAVAVNARSAGEVVQVEHALGFPVRGLQVPLTLENSLLVRALREARVFVTTDVSDMAGGALSDDIICAIREIAGKRTFAVVPVLGRIRPLGVMLCEKPGLSGFSPHERDLMITYAERLGQELESDALQNTAQRLEQLGALAVPPPLLWTCALLQDKHALMCLDPPAVGQTLEQALRLPRKEPLCGKEVLERMQTGETVVLNVSSDRPSVVASITTPWPLRLSLRKVAGDCAGKTLVVVAVEDLGWSEQVRRESLLAKERLAKVMSSVGDAILTLDAQAVITQVNESSEQALGMPPLVLCGRSVLDLAATPRARQKIEGMLRQLPNTGFAEAELPLLRASDEKRPRFVGHVSALLLGDESGSPAGAVFRVRDQTERRREDAERKRLRLRLLQTERLSALGEMAARIAHEVRNPLVSIGAAAQVIAEELPSDSPVGKEARDIGSEVQRLDRILQNVLRFARPTQATQQRTDVLSVLREVVERLHGKAHGLTFSVQVSRSCASGQVFALIDADKLRQVLWNVLINACEASRPGDPAHSAIECQVARQRRTGSGSQPGFVMLSIADTGAGISPAVRRRMFDPFFSTKTRGTGLGLSISRQILEEAGGRIRLLNRQTGGTRVVIELRSAVADDAIAAKPSDP